MQALVSVVLAAMLSATACYPLIRWSGRMRLTAQPRPDRWHRLATPNTGGVGILIASTACFLLFAPPGYGLIALCAAYVAILGFLDDRLDFPPLAKLLGQTAAAALLVVNGVIFPFSAWPAFNALLTMIWVIGITNAFNLIDNMDGLCGGVAAIAAISGAALAFLRGDGERAVLLLILAGACGGFLVYNHKPARIFMGDCGSMFLGFNLAALAVVPSRSTVPLLDNLYALPAFLYPLFDTALVSVLRRRAGRPISVGGRDHSSHRLVSAGMSERNTVWLLWTVAAACASCGPLMYSHRAWFIPTILALIAALAAFGRYLAYLPEFSTAAASHTREGSFYSTPAVLEEHEAAAHAESSVRALS